MLGTHVGKKTLGAVALFVAAASILAIPEEAHAIGLLIPTDQSLEPLMIRYHRVEATVRERVAETRVEQSFQNNTDRVLEATYVFPVPEGATVSGFAMWVNGQRQEGELLDAERARSIYEQIVARMRDPGLVEHMGGNLFRARVFPIAPRSEQRIEIRFTQTLPYESGVVHYRYPLRTGGASARTLEDMTVSANIVSRTPIRAVYSPTHAISVSRPDDNHAQIGFEASQVTLDEDFDLYYAVQDSDVGLSLLTHRGEGEDGYFLAMIAPRTEVTERQIGSKEVLFVIDTSGSMAGEKIDRAKAALDYMLARLNPSDHFQVVRFSTDVEVFFDGGASVPATPENVRRARDFARRFVAAGGTAIDPALTEALRSRAPRGHVPRMVVFLTDGMPTIGETHPLRIVENVTRSSGDSRLFVFGVGDDVNTTFLDQLAQANRGVGDYFRDGAEMERRLSAFYDRIAYPLLTDLRLQIAGLNAFDVYPRDLGHLYRGGQLFVVGRYRGTGQKNVELEGRVSNEPRPRTFSFAVNFPDRDDANDWIPRLFATRKVGFLLDQIRLRGERPELRDEVVALARTFGIVTPYTSYLVVDDQAIPPGLDLAEPERPVTGVRPLDLRVREADARPPSVSPEPAEESAFEGFSQATSSYDFEANDVSGSLRRPSSDAGGTGGAAPRLEPGRHTTRVAPATAPSGATGERGRNIARQLRSMREAEQTTEARASGSRFVDGRAFRLVRGMWIDSSYRRGMPTLRVRYGTPAYFALLRAKPELRRALALGDRVTVTIAGGRAVVVDGNAPDVNEAEVRRFFHEAH